MMKTAHPPTLIAAALMGALAFTTTAHAQTAPDANADATKLAQELQNPIADLISVPIQNSWDFGFGPADGRRFISTLQPIYPIKISKDWNLVIRTIVPYVSQEDVFTGLLPKYPGLPSDVLNRVPEAQRDALDRAAEKAFNKAARKQPVDVHQDGLGDILQSFFLSPKAPVGGWILGAGPVLSYPTATDDLLGAEKWSAGPTAVALRQRGPWSYGLLLYHLWSFAGNSSRDEVSSSLVNPWLAYTTQSQWTFAVQSESTYDWMERQWTVPVELQVAKLVMLGKQPVQFTLAGRKFAERPDGGPDWGVGFNITLLFPK
jgi:hypothetical protein